MVVLKERTHSKLGKLLFLLLLVLLLHFLGGLELGSHGNRVNRSQG